MNKALLTVLAALVAIGMSGAVAAQQADGNLNSIYGFDDEGDMYVVLFGEDATYIYGTVESFAELDDETAQICQQFVEVESEWWGLGDERVITSSECQDMALAEPPGEPELPEEIPGDEMENNEMNEENQEPMQEQQEPQQQPDEEQQQENPDFFYASDDEGNYMALVLDDGQITMSVGADSIEQLDQDTLVACEYFLVDLEPQEECYSYDELQDRIEQGEHQYLDEEEPEMEEENEMEDEEEQFPLQ